MDIACFVGFAAARGGPLSAAHVAWLRRAGWARELRSDGALPTRPLPLPFESWESFTQRFEPMVRDAQGRRWLAPLAGAVLDFFRQGGLRCYVLAVGAPPGALPGFASAPRLLDLLIPGAGAAVNAALSSAAPDVTAESWAGDLPSPHDRATWRGLSHLLGLTDAALLCLPDLPYLLGAPPVAPPPEPPPEIITPQFVECAPPDEPQDPSVLPRPPEAPRADAIARRVWREAVQTAAALTRQLRPDVQLVVALPLFERGSRAEADPLDALDREDLLSRLRDGGAGSAHVQVAWPWLRGDTSAQRMGGLTPPDGLLAGLLAQNALTNGTFLSAFDAQPLGVRGLEPVLDRRALTAERALGGAGRPVRLAERVCLFGATPQGIRLLSDVTTSADPSWHQGGVSRLMGVVHREARRAGESVIFEPSGPVTWRNLTRAVEAALEGVSLAGGLDGPGAWSVRCDRTTMSQQDLDLGRMVCRIEVQPAPTLERITVVLDVLNGGVRAVAEGV